MNTPRIAIISFPGNNCEVEAIRAVKNAGMEAVYFRWNEDTSRLSDVDGYFLPGGFSYEDRGRAGMVAGRDPVMEFVKEEAQKGKVVVGICNGAQVLVESGLIPLGDRLRMSLARNVVEGEATGFLNEWIWITPTCSRDRCATSDWDGVMQIPIAHGEGRFATHEKDLMDELKKNDQLAFSYCDETGEVSDDPFITPNGSVYAVAGICNSAGNVVALMPHPERTPNGAPFFYSVKKWIESGTFRNSTLRQAQDREFEIRKSEPQKIISRKPKNIEIFIDTIITNNEERTVEKAARRVVANLKLKQMKYFAVKDPMDVINTISLFNANKEIAYIRRGDSFTKWNPDKKVEENVDPILSETTLLRRDKPDTGKTAQIEETGICYVCSNIQQKDLNNAKLQQIFGNPHASTLELLA